MIVQKQVFPEATVRFNWVNDELQYKTDYPDQISFQINDGNLIYKRV